MLMMVAIFPSPFFGGLFQNMIWRKTIATFNHSENPSAWERTSEVDVLLKNFCSKTFTQTRIWFHTWLIPFCLAPQRSLEKFASFGVLINSQSLEDTQVGYISHSYTLDEYTLEKLTFGYKYTLRKYTPSAKVQKCKINGLSFLNFLIWATDTEISIRNSV